MSNVKEKKKYRDLVYKNLAKRLKELMSEHDISDINELAIEVGIDRNTAKRLLNGDEVTLKTLCYVAHGFGISIKELF